MHCKTSSRKLYGGMDVHKESIDIAVAEEDGEVRLHGRIGGEMSALWRTVRKLESLGRELVFVYEAGPCGYGIYRGLIARGHACWVVAPSNTPRRVRDRMSLSLARLIGYGHWPSLLQTKFAVKCSKAGPSSEPDGRRWARLVDAQHPIVGRIGLLAR